MAAVKPINAEQMRRISGVGEQKLHKYGQVFMDAILQQVTQHSRLEKGTTFQLTKELFRQGLSIQEIAQKREIKPETVVSHLVRLRQEGEPIDLHTLIESEKVQRVGKLIKYMEEPRLKAIFEGLDGQLAYYEIRLALACLDEKG